MNQHYEAFLQRMDTENKDAAVELVLDLLKKGELTLEELYLDFLTPALTGFQCPVADKELCIWKEHARTSIVRTILECTYPFVIERRKTIPPNPRKVVVFCPSEEFHEIGAIIVSHFFRLAGFDSQYIGANTPMSDVLSAIRAVRPDFVAISVTSYYNIIITKRITDQIKQQFPTVKVIVGGQAFLQQGALAQVPHDIYLKNVLDIFAWKEGEPV